ncbi:MAG: aminotransferase class I/II-fold pyridoxal phosphate-dependent enzyme [Candidatus Brocadia sp. BROELEC01]|nr:aminotransferase class I/II-fold pyridoxal phosphate-dependent enzyme [Candidatus Brocadia sapporoensis]QQR65604.1 MAG: aminotransferase class I/II-fold pyridoxal phosphate-dependent enzyme [Candidatus Brocadia sp.]RZV59897.1 MAG: aminotransferase class I/II-fold pyridoxal phosphate-dependent enzyme [Candidatus Brocadia sp. BROELEC01]
MNKKRIYLSSPHMGDKEFEFVKEAFETNWIAPVGPHVDMFEKEFCEATGARYATAVSSGSAAIHLALILLGIRAGDEVICSTLTFAASANPIIYQGATPVFIDSEPVTWNMDCNCLEDAIRDRIRKGKRPKAVIIVHLYGQSANMNPIMNLCNQYGIPLIEDAAESLGAYYKERHTGTFGKFGIFSFNGNKIITCSSGGMLVSDDEDLIRKAKFLATQARDPAPHYQHSHIGYNYRLSNVLAGIGRGQLRILAERVQARRDNFDFYKRELGGLPGIQFMPEAEFGRSNRWLTCLTLDPSGCGSTREDMRLALEAENIESRPVWKPLHLQPVFRNCPYYGSGVAEELFNKGLCLPSGSNLSRDDLQRVVNTFLQVYQKNQTISFLGRTDPPLSFV